MRFIQTTLACLPFAAICALGLSAVPSAHAEPAFLQYLFPPDLVMQHQREIGLSSKQRKAITHAIQRTQATTVEIHWDSKAEEQRLTELVSAPDADRDAIVAQATKLMELEVKVKRAHLVLLLEIRDQLRPEQREKLQQLRPIDPLALLFEP